MTNNIFVFTTLALKNRRPLTCVWTATGNPRQPLACRWVAQDSAQRPRILRGSGVADSQAYLRALSH